MRLVARQSEAAHDHVDIASEGRDELGDVVRALPLPLGQPDAASALSAYAAAGAPELVAALDDLAAGTAHFTPQAELIAAGAQASHAEKITADDARLDLTRDVAAVHERAVAVLD